MGSMWALCGFVKEDLKGELGGFYNIQ